MKCFNILGLNRVCDFSAQYISSHETFSLHPDPNHNPNPNPNSNPNTNPDPNPNHNSAVAVTCLKLKGVR